MSTNYMLFGTVNVDVLLAKRPGGLPTYLRLPVRLSH